MNKKNIFIIAAFILIALIIYLFISPKPIEQVGFTAEVIIGNLDTPWAIDFLPDGRMIFTERHGQVSTLDNNGLKIVGNIDVSEISESGLLGIAVDPEFENNRYVYLYYTYLNGNRVSRFILNDNLEDEQILLDNIPNARFHDGGRIKFGPDGKLYVTTGDATKPSTAQDIDSLAGKILRMNKDGSIPDDNPFGNYVYSYGHRNPQGLAWNPLTEELYSSEHGPTRNDEINIIVKGQNYGWPTECDENPSYINPIRCYTELTLAPGGIAFYKDDLYIAGLRSAQVRKIVLADDGKTILKEEELFKELGRIRDVVEYNDYLYIATSNRDGRGIPRINDDRIIRVKLS